uniref:Uncharacterized protein n=1 Tax=Oryza sativa subsp. japonica TaxID=39947 RepID=Q6EQN1_ORYSJ|nr:hypothetical protein [Oryza sativa Japonica Group]BAD29039.1 hypothetical protein [Oryza sativa Japonica Group]
MQGVYASEASAKRVPLLLVGEYLYSHPQKLAVGGRNPPTQCTAGQTAIVWPCSRQLPGGQSDWHCLIGQTGRYPPVRPAYQPRSDRPWSELQIHVKGNKSESK